MRLIISLCALFALACTSLAADLTEAELDRRIEQNRKADFVVKLVDESGKPITGEVKYELVRHAFGFGTAVNANFILHPSSAADLKEYESTLTRYFNCGVEENAMKWHEMERRQGQVDTKNPLAVWQWCHDRGITLRGHCIFWGIDEWVPNWVRPLDAQQTQAAMKARLKSVLTLMDGKISEWDLNNEMVHGDWFARKLGLKNGAAYFKWAHEIAPNVRFCVNDYCLPENRTDDYVKSIRAMLDDGAPIGGIGEQAHFHEHMPGNDKLWADLDELAQFKLPIKITEFDDDTRDPQQQAANLRRFYKVCFAHPSVEAILMWGFWEGRHWKPECALWSRNWKIRPNGEAFVKLVDDEWKTRGSAQVKDGKLQFRGFLGDYRLTSAGRTWTVHLVDSSPATAVP